MSDGLSNQCMQIISEHLIYILASPLESNWKKMKNNEIILPIQNGGIRDPITLVTLGRLAGSPLLTGKKITQNPNHSQNEFSVYLIFSRYFRLKIQRIEAYWIVRRHNLICDLLSLQFWGPCIGTLPPMWWSTTVDTLYSTIPYTTKYDVTWTHGLQNLQRHIRTLIVLLGFWKKLIFV